MGFLLSIHVFSSVYQLVEPLTNLRHYLRHHWRQTGDITGDISPSTYDIEASLEAHQRAAAVRLYGGIGRLAALKSS